MFNFATFIDYLDNHQGAATVILTAALVGVTSYYAAQNRRMVKEMAATRELSILPKLAVELRRVGPSFAMAEIRNVGPGPALEIDIHLSFEPISDGGPREERRWRRNLLAPDERREFMPPELVCLDELVATYREIRLAGSMKDATGRAHQVDEVFEDLPEWRELQRHVQQSLVVEPEKRLAEELEKKVKQPVAELTAELRSIARAVDQLHTPPADGSEPDAG